MIPRTISLIVMITTTKRARIKIMEKPKRELSDSLASFMKETIERAEKRQEHLTRSVQTFILLVFLIAFLVFDWPMPYLIAIMLVSCVSSFIQFWNVD